MTLVCPMQFFPEPTLAPTIPMLVFHRDYDGAVAQVLSEFRQASGFTLANYLGAPWSDALAEPQHDLWPAILGFLAKVGERNRVEPVALSEGRGQVSGIAYHVRSSGPPLLLLPLSLARSQWGAIYHGTVDSLHDDCGKRSPSWGRAGSGGSDARRVPQCGAFCGRRRAASPGETCWRSVVGPARSHAGLLSICPPPSDHGRRRE